jgi:uncharacterized peroxidase-related enzyme
LFLEPPEESEDTARVYDADLQEDGYVQNLTRLWAWRPDVHEAFIALRVQLTTQSSLSRRELAVLVAATASARGDSYCSLAWGNQLASLTEPAVAGAVLSGLPSDAMTARERALAAWARKVVDDPNATSGDDVDGLRAAGYSEKEIFEATAFVAFRLAFSTVNDALGAQPDWQLAAEAPAEVRSAVTYGRRPARRDE